ncbi:substrate-binding periplasmic protein [Rhodoferax sp.]|uniref:substrate-binding periplasmic protein n=1 Tax=Rhodoferax sp. TaxID=50421 RepID=UPI00275702CC|nr:transporter substrate-binding domain-containing protein [Rhodoferax sp.]
MRVLLALALTVFSANLCATQIGVYAPEEAPYQYIEASTGQPSGMAVEVVQLVLRELGLDVPVNIEPWPRIQKTRLAQPNNLIFTAYRNQDTETQYRWVGAIVPFRIYLYRLKTRKDVHVAGLADLKRYKVGVVTNGGRFSYLTKHGFAANLEPAKNDELNLRKFFAGRFDVLAEDPTMLQHAAPRYGLDPAQAEKLHELTDLAGEGYLAFTLGTSDALVAQFAKALDKVKAGKAYRELFLKYGL